MVDLMADTGENIDQLYQNGHQLQNIAVCQRKRTFKIYQTLIENSFPVTIYLVSGQTLKADQLIAVDSSESKFVFKGLQTLWGKSNRPVAIRGGDIGRIELTLKEVENPN